MCRNCETVQSGGCSVFMCKTDGRPCGFPSYEKECLKCELTIPTIIPIPKAREVQSEWNFTLRG